MANRIIGILFPDGTVRGKDQLETSSSLGEKELENYLGEFLLKGVLANSLEEDKLRLSIREVGGVQHIFCSPGKGITEEGEVIILSEEQDLGPVENFTDMHTIFVVYGTEITGDVQALDPLSGNLVNVANARTVSFTTALWTPSTTLPPHSIPLGQLRKSPPPAMIVETGGYRAVAMPRAIWVDDGLITDTFTPSVDKGCSLWELLSCKGSVPRTTKNPWGLDLVDIGIPYDNLEKPNPPKDISVQILDPRDNGYPYTPSGWKLMRITWNDTGKDASCSGSVLEDGSKSWDIDEWKDYDLIVLDTPAKRFRILSNTATTITIDGTLPTGTYDYFISCAAGYWNSVEITLNNATDDGFGPFVISASTLGFVEEFGIDRWKACWPSMTVLVPPQTLMGVSVSVQQNNFIYEGSVGTKSLPGGSPTPPIVSVDASVEPSVVDGGMFLTASWGTNMSVQWTTDRSSLNVLAANGLPLSSLIGYSIRYAGEPRGHTNKIVGVEGSTLTLSEPVDETIPPNTSFRAVAIPYDTTYIQTKIESAMTFPIAHPGVLSTYMYPLGLFEDDWTAMARVFVPVARYRVHVWAYDELLRLTGTAEDTSDSIPSEIVSGQEITLTCEGDRVYGKISAIPSGAVRVVGDLYRDNTDLLVENLNVQTYGSTPNNTFLLSAKMPHTYKMWFYGIDQYGRKLPLVDSPGGSQRTIETRYLPSFEVPFSYGFGALYRSHMEDPIEAYLESDSIYYDIDMGNNDMEDYLAVNSALIHVGRFFAEWGPFTSQLPVVKPVFLEILVEGGFPKQTSGVHDQAQVDVGLEVDFLYADTCGGSVTEEHVLPLTWYPLAPGDSAGRWKIWGTHMQIPLYATTFVKVCPDPSHNTPYLQFKVHLRGSDPIDGWFRDGDGFLIPFLLKQATGCFRFICKREETSSV